MITGALIVMFVAIYIGCTLCTWIGYAFGVTEGRRRAKKEQEHGKQN